MKPERERQRLGVGKKVGNVGMTGKSVLSADGKTTTVTQTGKDPQGRTINNVVIYDNQ